MRPAKPFSKSYVRYTVVILLALFVSDLKAQDGSLDATFGQAGVVTTAIGTNEDVSQAVAIQKDGKIIAAGYTDKSGPLNYDFALVRYNTNGSIDSSFGINGIVITDFANTRDYCRSVIIQDDGKIIAAGSAGKYAALARYKPNGDIDSSFGVYGKTFIVNGAIGQVLISPAGKLVTVGGYCVQYTDDGKLDSTFGTNGVVYIPSTKYIAGYQSLTILPDNKIILGGYFATQDNFRGIALAKLNANGQFDSSFGKNGVTEILDSIVGYSVLVSSSNEIFIDGYNINRNTGEQKFGLAKFTPAGIADSSFGIKGKVVTVVPPLNGSQAYSLIIQPDNKMIAGGISAQLNAEGFYNNTFTLAKYLYDGSLDVNFGTGGIAAYSYNKIGSYLYKIILQKDGKIIAAGYSQGTNSIKHFELVRYNNAAVLPVSLLNLSAARNGKAVVLNWQTANELNSNYFSIERGNMPGAFTQIGAIKSAGTSSQLRSYTFTDRNISSGKTYYRLKQVDLNGEYRYSNICFIDLTYPINIAAYPNPATDYVFIQGLNQSVKTSVMVVDANGKTIKTENTYNSNFALPLRELPAGLYLLKIISGGKTRVIKILKH